MAYMPYDLIERKGMNEFIVIAYEKDNGEVPVEDFLNSLDVKMRAKIFGMIGLFAGKWQPVQRTI